MNAPVGIEHSSTEQGHDRGIIAHRHGSCKAPWFSIVWRVRGGGRGAGGRFRGGRGGHDDNGWWLCHTCSTHLDAAPAVVPLGRPPLCRPAVGVAPQRLVCQLAGLSSSQQLLLQQVVHARPVLLWGWGCVGCGGGREGDVQQQQQQQQQQQNKGLNPPS
jgi:hypothetical protein